MMRIRELFQKDVTRPIAPVVYFHDDDPAKLRAEVSEYIVTGGYKPGDPRANRNPEGGIHEALVKLLRNLKQAIDEGASLPACWISGYYGSGKSSFAKLVALSLDQRELPNGKLLSEAFLARDESPLKNDLRHAWGALLIGMKPMAVTFDIGAHAHDGEHVHSVVVRQVQARLQYCTKRVVADFELALEIDGHYEAFLEAARKVLKKPWSELRATRLADTHFSHAMHALDPDRYREPTSWLFDAAHAGGSQGSDPVSSVRAIQEMMQRRAPGRTLFVVIDEVSQYVHDSTERMLKLQSFVSELGARLHGGVWLLTTGQQKLDDSAGIALAKLKDRYPEKLRVHLGTANIRDVVHQRLLKKNDAGAARLGELFEHHGADLRLFAYGCEDVTADDFADIYPMLPKQIDLVMDITTALRGRSSRAQGDAQTVRGLLQLLAALFSEQALGEREAGDLVPLDAIYDVLRTGLDADAQTTMSRIAEDCAAKGDAIGARSAKAVALLELVQRDDVQTEEARTNAKLVARCLYDRLGCGDREPQVTMSLERLRRDGFLGYSEKTGYKLASYASSEWSGERDALRLPGDEISDTVQGVLGRLMADVDKPKLGARPIPWLGFFSADPHTKDVRVARSSEDAVVTVDFRWATRDAAMADAWIKATNPDGGPLRDRLVWVIGSTHAIEELAGRLGRSQRMVRKYQPLRASLTEPRKALLREEELLVEALQTDVKQAVADAFLAGTFYFAGRPFPAREEGAAFATALHDFAERRVRELFPHYVDIVIHPSELGQLLEPVLSGPSGKFFEKGLGLLTMDAGKDIPTCDGLVPRRVLELLRHINGRSGSELLAELGKPPYGYAEDIVRATTAALLRAGKIRIDGDHGATLTDVRDQDAKNIFTRDRDFKRATFYVVTDEPVTQTDRNRICNVLERYLQVEIDRENGPIADAIHARFGAQRERLRQIERRFVRLPGTRPFPPKLERLAQALEQCRRSRDVAPTVEAAKSNVDVLRDGFEALGRIESDFTDAVLDMLVQADSAVKEHVAQLEAVDAGADVADDAKTLCDHLASERPWIDASSLGVSIDRVQDRYGSSRRDLLASHEKQAEATREKIKRRAGFERLGPDAAHDVLRPIAAALWDTTADAIAPRLDQLRDGFTQRLAGAEDVANERLDEALEGLDARPVVRVEVILRGREIETREELDALLREIEQRILEKLEKKQRVRLV